MPTHNRLSLAHDLGLLRALDGFWGRHRLTVLAYHRICDPHTPGFDGFAPNVSATPEQFARQMDFIRLRFSVIDLATLHRHVMQGEPLPPRPLLLTFDDGYLDNYTNAFPILRERGLPAVFFLVTSWIGGDHRPWWDRCAHAFAHSPRTRATLPIVGEQDLTPGQPRRRAQKTLIRALKSLSEADKDRALMDAFNALGVIPEQGDAPLFFDWDTARELSANGISCQPHTVSHPILTRVSPEAARREIAESCARIAAELGQPALAFAYPNGTARDYNAEIMQQLHALNVPLGFTLIPGPVRLQQVQRHALELPRIFIIHRDNAARFIVKLMGVPALLSRRRFVAGRAARGRPS